MTNKSLIGMFAVVQVTSGNVIWAGIAADATWAGKLAADALRTKIGASWHIIPATKLEDRADEISAVALGIAGGTSAVNELFAAEGKAAVIKADRSSKDDWDDRARVVDAAGIAGVAKGAKAAYYRAFAKAAHCRAEAIEDGES